LIADAESFLDKTPHRLSTATKLFAVNLQRDAKMAFSDKNKDFQNRKLALMNKTRNW